MCGKPITTHKRQNYGTPICIYTIIHIFSAQEKSDTTTIRKIEENLDLAQNNYYKAPELAGYYANEAVREAIKIQNDSLEIEALILLGTSYIHQSRFDMALDIYYQALDKEDRCSPATIAYLHACLGNSYRLLRNFKRASEFLDKSALYYKDFPNDPRESYYHNIKGLLHFVQKEYKQAEKEFNYALQINRRFNNSKAIAANLNNLGMLPEHFQEKSNFWKKPCKSIWLSTPPGRLPKITTISDYNIYMPENTKKHWIISKKPGKKPKPSTPRKF